MYYSGKIIIKGTKISIEIVNNSILKTKMIHIQT